jgi:hypothetical protein
MALSERGRFLSPQTPARYPSINPFRTRQPGRDLYLPPAPQGGFFRDDERSLLPKGWKGGKAVGQDPGGNPGWNPAPAAREGKNRGRKNRRPLLENSTHLEALLYYRPKDHRRFPFYFAPRWVIRARPWHFVTFLSFKIRRSEEADLTFGDFKMIQIRSISIPWLSAQSA